MNRYFRNLAFLVAFLLLSVSVQDAAARISGTFELDYGHFEASENDVEVADATHFAQRYSLFYEKRGQIMEGRGGRYDLALGGEWTSVESDITVNSVQNDVDIETSKVLYRGELIFAPGGIPVYFRLYSRDMQESRFEFDNRLFSTGNFSELRISRTRKNILDPQVVEDIDDGEAVQTGASLVLGIRNGSYLGQYREVFSLFPKIFVDYLETYVKDLKSLTPEHYKDRELAYVSLNKKHNWIHYRFFDHDDIINSVNDYTEETYLIGNVNQYLQREWVNLTNWIEISADGRLTSEKNPRNVLGDENIYELNLFTKTRRANWRSAIYSTYRRWEKIDDLERTVSVPVFADGEIDRNTSWRLKFIGEREKDTRPFALVNQTTDNDGAYTLMRFDLNKTRRYILSPQLEAEIRNGSEPGSGKGSATKVGVDLASNKKSDSPYDVFAGASFSYFEGEPSSPTLNDVDHWEIEGEFNVARSLTARMRTGIESRVVYGDGAIESAITEYLLPVNHNDLREGTINAVDIRDQVRRYDFVWFGEHVAENRLKNRLEAGVKYLEIDKVDSSQVSLLHRLDYNRLAVSFSMTNELVSGDNIRQPLVSSSLSNLSLASGAVFDGWNFNSQSNFYYTPNRSWQTGFILSYDFVNSDLSNDGGHHVQLEQNWQYRKYLNGNRLRRVYDFEEVLDYELFDLENGRYVEIWMMALLANYYPTSWSRLGGKIRSQQNLESDLTETGFGLYADLIFSKFDLGLEYEYGMRTDDELGLVMDRDEQRWQVNVRKTF